MDEEEFWNSSVEKINELVEVHGATQDSKLAKKRKKKLSEDRANTLGDVYIDQVGFL